MVFHSFFYIFVLNKTLLNSTDLYFDVKCNLFTLLIIYTLNLNDNIQFQYKIG